MDKTTNVSEHSIFPSEQDSYVWLERTVDTLRVNMSRAPYRARPEVYLQTGFTRFDLHVDASVAHGDDAFVGFNDKSRFKLTV